VLLFPSALSKELLLPLSKFATVFVGKNIYCVVFYSAQGAEADSTFDVRVLSFMKIDFLLKRRRTNGASFF
jgi:hypothetical protein